MNSQLLDDSKQRIGSRLNNSMHLVAEAIALVRNVMTDLRPAVLDDYGLEAALQSYIDEYKSRYDVKVFLDASDQPIPRLGPSIEMTSCALGRGTHQHCTPCSGRTGQPVTPAGRSLDPFDGAG